MLQYACGRKACETERATTFGCFKQNVLLVEYLVDNLFKI